MRIAVITGASSGMGREFLLQVTKEETFDEIWAIARDEGRLSELKALSSCPVRPISLDLTEPNALNTYKAMLMDEMPDVRLLVNAAGFGRFGEIEEIGPEEHMNMIDLNCRALTGMTELTLPYMSRGSRIVQIASVAAYQPVPYITVYAATKAYVLSYSRALNAELKGRGVRVMAVCPYWTNTNFFGRAMPTEKKLIRNFTVMLDPKAVVEKAIRDLYHGTRDVSIYGLQVQLQVLGVKLMPHKFVMDTFLRQQGLK